MDHRPLAMAFTVRDPGGHGVLGRVVPKGFIPSEDQGQLSGTTETAEGTSYDAMVRHQLAAAAIVQEDPNVEGYMSAVGGGGRNTTVNQGRLLIRLKPRNQRALSADEVAQSLTRKLAAVPGLRVYLQNPPVINIGGRSSKSQYQFTLYGSDMDALYQGAAALEQRLHSIPGLTDVTSDLQIKNPQVQVTIARDRAAALGIDVSQIENALYNAYGARQVSTIYTPNDQYWVVMELLPQYQRDLSAMNLLHISGRQGVLGPLGQPGSDNPGHGSAHGESLRTAALGDTFIQPRSPAPLSAPRWTGCRRQRDRFCPPLSAPASPARRRPFRPRNKDCSCCSSLRSW